MICLLWCDFITCHHVTIGGALLDLRSEIVVRSMIGYLCYLLSIIYFIRFAMDSLTVHVAIGVLCIVNFVVM